MIVPGAVLILAVLATASDICDFQNDHIFCDCRKRSASCTVFGNNTFANDTVWSLIDGLENVDIFSIRTMLLYSLHGIPVVRGMDQISTLNVKTAFLTKVNISEGFDKLSNLDLQSNGIVDVTIANLPKLTEILLDDNSITSITTHTFYNLPSISKLFLIHNNISRIDSCAFCNVTSLVEIDLLGNNLTSLETGTFRRLTNLQRLDLLQNEIKSIEDYAFQDLSRLTELNLKNNKISSLGPKAFEGLSNLLILRLDENRIKGLPDHLFRGLTNLAVLDLSINQLTHLQASVIGDLDQAFSMNFNFFFKDNPLECTCGLSWIQEYIDLVNNVAFRDELKRVKCKVVDIAVFSGNVTQGKIIKLSNFNMVCARPSTAADKDSAAKDKAITSTDSTATDRDSTTEDRDSTARDGPAPGPLVDKMKGSPQFVDEQKAPPSSGSGTLPNVIQLTLFVAVLLM